MYRIDTITKKCDNCERGIIHLELNTVPPTSVGKQGGIDNNFVWPAISYIYGKCDICGATRSFKELLEQNNVETEDK